MTLLKPVLANIYIDYSCSTVFQCIFIWGCNARENCFVFFTPLSSTHTQMHTHMHTHHSIFEWISLLFHFSVLWACHSFYGNFIEKRKNIARKTQCHLSSIKAVCEDRVTDQICYCCCVRTYVTVVQVLPSTQIWQLWQCYSNIVPSMNINWIQSFVTHSSQEAMKKDVKNLVVGGGWSWRPCENKMLKRKMV